MENKKIKLKFKILTSVLIVIVTLGVVGISFAWLAYWHRLNTISVVQIPSKISISGANRSEMQKISLEMTSDDTQVDNTVTIRRVFCIESTDDFLLEVAHTTNIPNMDIQIFPVSNENSKPEKTTGAVQGADAEAGRIFYYDPDTGALSGEYLNLNQDGKIANDTLNGYTYAEGDIVQQNAEPLYWLTNEEEVYNKEEYSRPGKAADGQTDIFYRYYVLQLSWDITDSETDMVYLLASHQE